MIPITRVATPAGKISRKCPKVTTKSGVCIHNTANDASAMAEISYMLSNNNAVSFHFAVDHTRAVQGIDLSRNTYHCANATGNNNQISIEICYSKSGGTRFLQAELNAAELTAHLLKQRGWGINKVTKHQDWNGKYCPHRTLDMGWNRFLNLIRAFLNGETNVTNDGAFSLGPSLTDGGPVTVGYCAKNSEGWRPTVSGGQYAGNQNKAMTAISIGVNRGSLKYRAHVKGGRWLPWVTGCDVNDHENGYAGNGRDAIDAIMVVYLTPAGEKYKQAWYKVSTVGRKSAAPLQRDNNVSRKKGYDGYAGNMGQAIDLFKMEVYSG